MHVRAHTHTHTHFAVCLHPSSHFNSVSYIGELCISCYQTVQQLKDRIAQMTFPQRPSVKQPPVRKVTRSPAYASTRQLQEQTQQPSPTQQLPRKWSDINCCVLLQKPLEKILIRYLFYSLLECCVKL
jgi:hypothetical protein